jgi:hypothetical protein
MASAPIEAPCDDDPASATAAGGAQDITLNFELLVHWLMSTMDVYIDVDVDMNMNAGRDVADTNSTSSSSLRNSPAARMQCQVVDIYGGNEDAGTSRALGSFTGSFTAKMVPAHGVAFVLVGNCTMHAA